MNATVASAFEAWAEGVAEKKRMQEAGKKVRFRSNFAIFPSVLGLSLVEFGTGDEEIAERDHRCSV